MTDLEKRWKFGRHLAEHEDARAEWVHDALQALAVAKLDATVLQYTSDLRMRPLGDATGYGGISAFILPDGSLVALGVNPNEREDENLRGHDDLYDAAYEVGLPPALEAGWIRAYVSELNHAIQLGVEFCEPPTLRQMSTIRNIWRRWKEGNFLWSRGWSEHATSQDNWRTVDGVGMNTLVTYVEAQQRWEEENA